MKTAFMAAYIEGYDQDAKNNDPYRDVEIRPPIGYNDSGHLEVSGTLNVKIEEKLSPGE